MDDNEKYVRERLTKDYIEQMWHEIECDDFWQFWSNKKSPITRAAKWIALKAFTKDRKRKIAEVKKEIAWLADGDPVVEILNGPDQPLKRILSREQSVLAALKSGMREE